MRREYHADPVHRPLRHTQRNMTRTANAGASVNPLRVLVQGGGDVGSAVAHRLFLCGQRVLICDRAQSPHARRGMAFTDALFDGVATLEGVQAQWLADIAAVADCWAAARSIPVMTLPESLLAAAIRFDVVVDATMRRNCIAPDQRHLTECFIGLGPGYAPGQNCHVAIETQWGSSMGQVLRESEAAQRSGGPRALAGVTRERFGIAPATGIWRTAARLGAAVNAGDAVGTLGEHTVRAPINGHLRGLARDGVQVSAGQRLLEVDPRPEPQIFGLGDRPRAIAVGVAKALGCDSSASDSTR